MISETGAADAASGSRIARVLNCARVTNETRGKAERLLEALEETC